MTKEERAAIRQQLAKMPGRFGDRRCRLTVIGESGEIDDFALALRQCLLTEEEILWWQQGIFHDPRPRKWPGWLNRLFCSNSYISFSTSYIS
uniref:hypothetical protein n=1 Tax=Klebsiella pneumoniae TaxID=573 RepID=UPI001D11970E|nr:hypothetical protein [Klebsiella pneumoniae]